MADPIGQYYVSIKADVSKLKKEIEDLKGKLKKDVKEIESNTGNRLTGMFKGVGASIVAAFGTAAIVRFGFEAVTLAGKVQGVKTAFDNLNQPGLLQNLRDATRNTVSDFELMKLAMRASNFKIPLTELGTLLEFAEKRASQTGQEVDFLVNSIIDGIGRKSTLVLDNLGISAQELQTEFAKTGDFGKATANIISREMQKMGAVVETTATKMAQLNAQVENQKAEIGKNLLPVWSGFLRVLSSGVSFLTAMGQEFKRTVSPARYYGEIISDLTLKHQEYARMLEKTYISQVKLSSFIISTYKQQKDTIGKVREKIDELVIAQDGLVFGSEAYLKNVKEIERLEKSIGLGKEVTIEKPKDFGPEDIKAKFIGVDTESWEREKKIMFENTDLMKLKRGELALYMQEVNQGTLDNSMFTTEAIRQDWIDKNEGIKESINSVASFSDGLFNQVFIKAEWANSMIEQGFVSMANAFIAQVQRMTAEWIAFQVLRGIFSIATGGAAAAIPIGHNGGNFIGTSSGVKKMAGGGSFIVPPGFPNDSYPLLVESGERVTVNPTSQTGMESRLLKQVVQSLQVLNANTIEGQLTKARSEAVAIYGKIENDAIYLSNKRAAKIKNRIS